MAPMRWPVACVMATHTGQDGLVRVVQVKTSSGSYTRPANKLVLLLCDNKPSLYVTFCCEDFPSWPAGCLVHFFFCVAVHPGIYFQNLKCS